MIISGKPVAFGVKPEWAGMQIEGVPQGAKVVKTRFRTRSFAVAIVHSTVDRTITRWSIGLTESGGLRLLHPLGINGRPA